MKFRSFPEELIYEVVVLLETHRISISRKTFFVLFSTTLTNLFYIN